jgi:hypothetical protein
MEERQVILDATCAGNPVALKAIRDTSPNAMARVQAIRTLEALEERMDKETGSRELPASGDCVRDRGRPYREDDRTVATHHRTWSLRWTQSWTNRTKRAIICQHEV